MQNVATFNLISDSVRLRQNLTQSSYGTDELMRIYLARSVTSYFRQDASMGGYVPHARKLRKRNFFI